MPDLNENPVQKEAIMFADGAMQVLAGPGSGKTFVTIQRIKYLIEICGVEPSSILVITFTKAAANEMKQRFYALMKEQMLPVNFGTFHAIFYHILRQTGQYHRKRKRHLLRMRRTGTSAAKVSSGIFCLFKGQRTSTDKTGISSRCEVFLPVSD